MDKIYKFNELSESKSQNYMFFKNLKNIEKMVTEILDKDEKEIDEILNEHDWASDHISKSMESITHVYKFLSVKK